MPYASDETPKVGDRIRHDTGRFATVTEVRLNQPHLNGQDQLSIRWDDGEKNIRVAPALAFSLVKKTGS